MTGHRFSALIALTLPAMLAPTSTHAQELVHAARAGRMAAVQTLLTAEPGGTPGVAVDQPDPSGYTALRWAAIRGQGEIAILLLDAGADPNTMGADGGTSVHGAAHHDDAALMIALLEAGGDITIQNRWGRTPLHVAARRGNLDVAELLLAHEADPDATTTEGWSTLDVAYRGGHPEMVELLLAHGADPELADAEGRRPGEVTYTRPAPTTLNRRQLDEYVGRYSSGEMAPASADAAFHIWRVGDAMYLREFAPDLMVPIAPDTFVTVQEPWRVVFHRGGAGEGGITGITVDFQRRSVTARKVVDTSSPFSYVGSSACLQCHSGVTSHHQGAWITLTTEGAKGAAAARGDTPPITDPSQDQRCVMCHVTAAQNPNALWAEGRRGIDEGVGCEACHGPGSAYIAMDVMTDRESFLANGGRIPDELTCRGCHRDDRFDFEARVALIKHGG